MSRGNNNGWDFVKVNETYQYKESGWICMVKVLEDNSTDKEYNFKLQVEKSSWAENPWPKEFVVSHNKNFNGVYSEMNQIYKNEEYMVDYKWVREDNLKKD